MVEIRRALRSAQPWMRQLFWSLPLVAILITQGSIAAPVVQSDSQAMIYLSQFGYLDASFRNPSSGALISEDSMKHAISEFQAFAGLNVTGDLDEETKELMSTPRCGVKDKVGLGHNARRKRYALQGSRWRVRELTYKISKYPMGLSQEEVDREIAKSFQVWSESTELNFVRKKSGQVHIEIRFERGEHGDGDPFDGPGGTLAHAYFPVYGGDAHFDDSEAWTVRSRKGTNLFQVAAHEFGHSLGLSHSDVKTALMAPFYRGYNPSFNLDSDDVIAIQELYGKKKTAGPKGGDPSYGGGKKPEPEEPPTGEDVELCTDARIDTLFNSAEGATYAFKGDHYWKLSEQGIHRGYPRPISQSWPGLPGNIDAAFTYKNGKTYFFKDSQYWRFTGKTMDPNYPMKISEGFTGIPDNVDAAMVWGGNGKIYFYKGSKFWRFDPSQRPPVKSTYPKPIANWEGIPDNIDAALQYTNGYTYFFKDGLYYRFNDRTFMVDAADPPFPRAAGFWWFGCRSASKGHIGNDLKTLPPNVDEDNSMEDQSGVEHSKPTLNSNRNSDVDDLILDAGVTGGGVGTRDMRERNGSSAAAHITNLYHNTFSILAALAVLRIILPRP